MTERRLKATALPRKSLTPTSKTDDEMT